MNRFYMCTSTETNRQLPLFVENRLANRVAEIRRSNDITFCYILLDQNPADLLTQGLTVNELSNASYTMVAWVHVA